MKLRRLFALLVGLVLFAGPAGATWSIVVVNRRTGEVAVASATCLSGFNLRLWVPVIAVGKGAGAAQSILDTGAVNRSIIYASLVGTSLTPQEILDLLDSDVSFQSRQYGIAAFTGAPVTFTGRRAGGAASGVTGEFDDYAYAIQGNLLTDDAVVLAAEAAFRSTPGDPLDMGQRVMAAMEAARALGGDGRCSCSANQPTSCGAPPPSFTKSAHCGFVIVARIGDLDVPCDPNKGCAQGSYYLIQNIAGQNTGVNDPDPVLQLAQKYADWRANLAGRPDGILSSVESVQSLPADGVTRRTVTVRLADVDGVPLAGGGASLVVATVDGLSSLASVGPVTDHGDGSYGFELVAGTEAGLDRFVITADDGVEKATLYPYLDVRLDAPAPLHAGYDAISASLGATVPFVVDVPSKPKGVYWILGSLSGTVPGLRVGPFTVPLNPDSFTWSTFRFAGTPGMLPGTAGFLDATGRADGAFVTGPGQLVSLAGMRIDWAAVVLGKGPPLATNPAGFDVLP